MYYPEHRHVLSQTTIRRERMLPDQAIGSATAKSGDRVDLSNTVARGTIPAHFVIVEAARDFRLKTLEELDDLLLVEAGDRVEVDQPLAGRSAEKGRRLLSPVDGVVAHIGDGRIILQEAPEQIEVEAGLNGQVVEVRRGRGVVIEAAGALVQGVWGNNRRTIGTLRMEPDEGLESLLGNELDLQYRSTIIVTKRPLTTTSLLVIDDQRLSGVIAPSMDGDLVDEALSANGGVLLTVGFGSARMSTAMLNTLSELDGRQALLDATLPERWEARRPEVVVSLALRAGERPPEPDFNLTLQPGTAVRLTSAPNAGASGQIVDLPKTPVLIDNGLRVACAKVELVTGEVRFVPFTNLEVLGK